VTEQTALRDLIKAKLLELEDPETGERIIDTVYFREEVYHGQQTPLAPDILFVARDYAYLGRALFGSHKSIERTTQMGNGFHRMNGVFMAWGPDIKPGFQVEKASIADLASTTLYSFGFPIPDDMDGQVLTQIFCDELVNTRPVTFTAAANEAEADLDTVGYTDKEAAQIGERLRMLGYLD
jgi:predicted AlkP superfamily phosphohydrolase/phosphomutase